ncbi:MAG TPA: HIT family protein [Acidimicrobiales bacterium]|nr:HIT family protein [Acidimicrobiales bacterium]
MAEAGGGCVFDRIRDGETPGHVVLDEGEVLAFLDARPVFPGHTLVVPRRHVATLADLDGATAGAVWAAGRRIARALRPALGAQGAFLCLNDEVSQSVAHVHLHVVPRRFKDGLRGFLWPRQRYADEGEAAGVAARIAAVLAADGGPG